MPTVRFFAGAREAAGTDRVEIDASTVGAVLDAVVAGAPALEGVLPSCKIWVNGEPAERTDPVGEGDEVAVLPPVSGGATG